MQTIPIEFEGDARSDLAEWAAEREIPLNGESTIEAVVRSFAVNFALDTHKQCEPALYIDSDARLILNLTLGHSSYLNIDITEGINGAIESARRPGAYGADTLSALAHQLRKWADTFDTIAGIRTS